jgi:AcrR family transcriptional regulator
VKESVDVDSSVEVGSTVEVDSTVTVATRSRMSGGDRRRQLIDVGWKLLQSRPIHEMALDEVAVEAGISRTLLFHYFPTKGDFYAAVVEAAGERMLKPVRVAPDATPVERVHTLIDGFIRLVERNRVAYTSLVRGAGGGDVRVVEAMARVRDALVPRWLAAAGHDDAGPLARLILRGWLVGMEETVLAWDAESVDRDELIDHLTTSLFAELDLAQTP